MNNKILNKIIDFAISELNREYGVSCIDECNEALLVISLDDEGKDIIIKLSIVDLEC